MESTPGTVSGCDTRINIVLRQMAARICLAVVCFAGGWSVLGALTGGRIHAALLPVCAIAFLGAARTGVRTSHALDAVESGISHTLVLASAAAFGPLGGSLPALFSGLGILASNSSSSEQVRRPVLVFVRPAAAALAGLAFSTAGGETAALKTGWPLLAYLAAACAYALVYRAAAVAQAALEGREAESAGQAMRRFAMPCALSYLLSIVIAAAPAQACLAVALVASAVLVRGRQDTSDTIDVCEEDLSEVEPDVPTPQAKQTESDAGEQTGEKAWMLDPVTGAANIRYLMMFLNQEISRSGRNKHSLSLLLLDIDGLKAINTELGSDTGDLLLKDVASSLKSMLRDYDLIARYTDDEFAVVFPETEIETAYDVAERIHKALTEREYTDSTGQGFRVGISVGVASFPDHGSNPDQLIASVNHALNRAKFSGSNKVCSCHKLAKAS